MMLGYSQMKGNTFKSQSHVCRLRDLRIKYIHYDMSKEKVRDVYVEENE